MMVPKLRFPNFRSSWISETLGDVFEITSGSTPSRSNLNYFKNGHISWVKTTDLNNGLIQSTQEKVTENAIAETSSLKILPKGTVFVAMYGGFNQIGRTGMLIDDAACNQALSAIKPNKKRSDPYFLLSYLNFKVDAWKLFAASSRKDPNITKKDVSDFTFNHPCIEEQIKIADFICSVDEKITLLSKQYDLLRHYKKGIMRKVFSQEVRFKDERGEKFSDWNQILLGKVGEIITGKTPSTSVDEFWNGDILFTTPTDMNDSIKYLVSTERKVTSKGIKRVLPKGTIMFTCIASIGKMALSTLPCITNQQINSIIVDEKYNNEFIYYCLQFIRPKIISSQANTTVPIVNKSDFSAISLQIPNLAEQTKIANFLSALDDKIASKKAELDKLKTWKQGLLQQMFV